MFVLIEKFINNKKVYVYRLIVDFELWVNGCMVNNKKVLNYIRWI